MVTKLLAVVAFNVVKGISINLFSFPNGVCSLLSFSNVSGKAYTGLIFATAGIQKRLFTDNRIHFSFH